MGQTNTIVQPVDFKQREAATDPTRSFIVQAPAGSGKTTLLVERYLRLLSLVQQPEEVLAITFTRKAANEMRSRVLDRLQTADPADEIVSKVLERNKVLNWHITANPQQLRIQTIDSFNRSLVKQLPFTSRLSLDYDITTKTHELYELAAQRTISQINDPNSPFVEDIAAAVAMLDNDYCQLSNLLSTMLGSRQQWLPRLLELIGPSGLNVDKDALLEGLRLDREAFCKQLKEEVMESLGAELYTQMSSLAVSTLANLEMEKPDYRKEKQQQNIDLDWAHLYNTFFTQGGKLRKRVDKRQGFPADQKELKDELKELVEVIQNLDPIVLHRLDRIKNLPSEVLTEVQEEGILSYATTLIVAANELMSIFKETQVTDHTEVAIAAHRALEVDNAPTQLALALDYRIKHILVDEYQDTSVAQNQLLNLLMDGWVPDDGNTFFAVGDPMQSIYTFRDADLTNFLLADQGGIRNRELHKLTLTANFRSKYKLIDFCNEVFEKVLGEADDPERGVVGFSKSDKTDLEESELNIAQLNICQSTSNELEFKQLATKLRDLVDTDPDSSKVILLRSRTKLEPLFDELRAKELAWEGVEITSLADLGVVRDLHSLATAICKPDDRLSWFAVLMSPLAGLPIKDIDVLSDLKRGIDTITQDLGAFKLSDESKLILNRIREPILNAIRSQQKTLRSRLERLWYELGGPHGYPSDVDPNRESLKTNALHYLELLESMPGQLPDLEELWRQVTESYATETNPDADLEVMTIHKAKGLEFDHVVIPLLNSTTRSESPDLIYFRPMVSDYETGSARLVTTIKSHIEDDPLHNIIFAERKTKVENETARLLYVAATRAKQSLWMYATQKDITGKPSSRSFLNRILEVVPGATLEYVHGEEDTEGQTVESRRLWFRVSPDFEFKQPTSLAAIPAGLISAIDTQSAQFEPLDLANSLAESSVVDRNARFRDFYDILAMELSYSESLVIGQYVHAELQRVVQAQSISMPTEARVDMWRNQLRTNGFTTTQTASILEEIQDQLQATYQDDVGQWLLDPNHQGSDVEKPFVFPAGGSNQTTIVDRSFIDDGIRWVIDYKTSKVPDDDNLDLNLKAQQYEAQLMLYGKIYQSMEDLPVKAGIYFTDVGILEEVDVSEDAASLLGSTTGTIAEMWNIYRSQRQHLRN